MIKTGLRIESYILIILVFAFLLNQIVYVKAEIKHDPGRIKWQIRPELSISLAKNDKGESEEESKKTNVNNKNNEKGEIKDNKKSDINAQKQGENKDKDKEYIAERKKADWIIRTIDNGTHKDRKNAISEILSIKDQGIKKELGEKLIDIIKSEAELEVKLKAITIAGEIKLKDSGPYLINNLKNEPEDISVAAVYAIKRIGDTSAKPAMIEKLKEQKLENPSTLTEALIDTLGEFKAAELSGFACEAIKSTKTNQIVRELFVLFLGKIESKESKDTLLALAKDEDETEQIRSFAVNSIANLNMTEAIPEIEKITQTIDSYPFNKKKKYFNLYIYSISALVKLGDEKAFLMFLNALRSDNAVVRLKAINLIRETRDKRTIDILKYKMNYDPSPKVQSAAKSALKELGVDTEAIKKESPVAGQNNRFNSGKPEGTQKDMTESADD